MRGRAFALGGSVLTASLCLLGGLAVAGGGPTERNIDVSPTSHSFGGLCIGSSSSPRSFRISNTAQESGGESLQVSSLSRSGPADFTFTNPTPVLIAPQSSVTFTITFKPQAHGSRNADFTITSDDPDNSQEHVIVSGSGIDRRLSADRTSVSFGEQRVGTRSPTQSLVMRNTGGDAVTVTSVTRRGTSAGEFLVTPPAVPFTIAKGDFKTIALAFQPSAAGLRSASVEIVSNVCSGSKVTVSLVGTGVVPNVVVDPNPIDVGSSPKGKQSKPTSVSVSNDGHVPLKITAIQVIGTNSPDFALEGLPLMPVTVAPAGTLVFDVRMTATEEGLRSASLNVISDDPDAPAFTVPLRGNAGAASPSTRPTTSRRPSPSPSTSVPQSGTASPQALGKPANDSLAVGMVIGGVGVVFGALIVIRRMTASRDED